MSVNARYEELATQLRGSVGNRKTVRTELETSQRIIARVTDGIYREPWAAFRELAANAYDADATIFTVDTGYPSFDQMIFRDNGHGMSPESLAYMLRNIGGSSKRTQIGTKLGTALPSDPTRSPGGRPLIGKIGIGLFAVAQLTQHFQIITKASGEALRCSATVKLRTHIDAPDDEDEDFVAGIVEIITEKVSEDELLQQGTEIRLYQIRPEIRRILQSEKRWFNVIDPDHQGDSLQPLPTFHIGAPQHLQGELSSYYDLTPSLPWEDEDSPQERFRKFFEVASSLTDSRKPATLNDHFDEYFQLIWKLSLSMPVPYIDGHPLETNGSAPFLFYNITNERRLSEMHLDAATTVAQAIKSPLADQSNGTSFGIMLDGVSLHRPIRLHHSLKAPSRLPRPMLAIGKVASAFGEDVWERSGGDLSFTAYFYWNSRIVPKDNHGVLIRIRGASGTLFDHSFLNYRISEQNRLKQICCEIFVHKGLDSAINIDRESFNYSHPHFLYVQKWTHRALRLLINRNKAIAKDDLEQERQKEARIVRGKAISRAIQIWDQRKSNSADRPYLEDQIGLIKSVGQAEIYWEDGDEYLLDETLVSALAIVLEAHDLLSGVSPDQARQIIQDLSDIIDVYSGQ